MPKLLCKVAFAIGFRLEVAVGVPGVGTATKCHFFEIWIQLAFIRYSAECDQRLPRRRTWRVGCLNRERFLPEDAPRNKRTHLKNRTNNFPSLQRKDVLRGCIVSVPRVQIPPRPHSSPHVGHWAFISSTSPSQRLVLFFSFRCRDIRSNSIFRGHSVAVWILPLLPSLTPML